MSTAAITPRWEWRCFASSLTSLALAVSISADAAPRESDETYILDLTGRNSENIKVRDGVLDVKRLLRTDADGLELWRPVLKARFPLGREEVAAVFQPWLPMPPGSARDTYTLAELLSDIVARAPALRLAEVHKSRRGTVFAECLAELAEIRVDSASLETFSLEHEDPKRLIAALRMLGLDPHANTNYILGLKRALGLEHAAL